MTERAPRHKRQTQLDRDLVDSVRACAEANDVNLASLWYLWITQGAQLAARGLGHLLPQVPLYGTQRRVKRGSYDKAQLVSWRQGAEEFARDQALINEAGSSVPAVLQAGGHAYVEANGDIVTMSWPPQNDDSRAA